MRITSLLVCIFMLAGCYHNAYHGPDKQFSAMVKGAAAGAGTGAIAGFHLSSATGPGAAVGAGFGAVMGGIHGFVHDLQEEAQLALKYETQKERQIAYAHAVLTDHFRRRMELHPTRDIFPADLFFEADSVALRDEGCALVEELAWLNKNRYPWSRLVVAVYVKARDPESTYAKHLAYERSKEIGNYFVRAGIEPRRITTRAVVVDAPLILDPTDRSDRFAQAIELIPIDR